MNTYEDYVAYCNRLDITPLREEQWMLVSGSSNTYTASVWNYLGQRPTRWDR
jgi:hypothetical protein